MACEYLRNSKNDVENLAKVTTSNFKNLKPYQQINQRKPHMDFNVIQEVHTDTQCQSTKHILTQSLHHHHTQVIHSSAGSLRPQSHLRENKSVQPTEGSSVHHNVTTSERRIMTNITESSEFPHF
jgi:hypothetical protein